MLLISARYKKLKLQLLHNHIQATPTHRLPHTDIQDSLLLINNHNHTPCMEDMEASSSISMANLLL